jgi:hypothetical protein
MAIESPRIKITAPSARLIESPQKRIIHVLRRPGNYQFQLEFLARFSSSFRVFRVLLARFPSSFFDNFVDSKGLIEFVPSILTSFSRFHLVSRTCDAALGDKLVPGIALALASRRLTLR